MRNLVVVALEDEATMQHARRLLAQSGIILLEDAGDVGAGLRQPDRVLQGRVRRWAVLPIRATSVVLAGTLTAIAWTGLVLGSISGDLAQRLSNLADDNALPPNARRAAQSKDRTLVMIATPDLPADLAEQLRQLNGRVWQTPLTEEQAAKLQAKRSRS